MIIRSNLASVPIKNYTLYLIGSLFLALIIVLFTAWNLLSVTRSYTQTAELNRNIQNQQKQLREMETKQKKIQDQIARIKTPQFIAETNFMNNAIKRRTFSWTELFDHFEEVLPPSVRMISISPTVTEGIIAINLEMAGQSLEDMLELVRLLERDPAFSQVVLKGENSATGEQILFSISLNYTPVEMRQNNAASAASLGAKGTPIAQVLRGGSR